MISEEIQHNTVKARGVAMKIQSMARIRLDVSFERTRVRKNLLRARQNGRKLGRCSREAVPTAVDFIFV